MSFLVVEGLARSYGAVTALRGVSLSVAPGSRTAVVGPSGCGKTTLLRLVAGFEAPDAGRIVLDGQVVADGARTVPAHRRGVGIVAQDGALFPHLGVAENIAFGLPRRAPGRAATIGRLMRLVGLDPAMASRRPDQLSGGQQQRVALARAMAPRPRLMLLDEPFSALDTALRASTRQAVAAVLAEAGITALLVTHDQAEAMSFADQVAVMRDGTLVQAGPPADLYARPIDPETAAFLGEAVILPATVAAGQAGCALGTLPVPGAVDGRGTLMLRPEQLVLLAHSPAGGQACPAEVLATDFAGASCAYTLRLSGTGHVDPVLVRQPGPPAFTPGAAVFVAVQGQAHLFGTGGVTPAAAAPST